MAEGAFAAPKLAGAGSIELLFRFRDLVAATIPEHSAIIRDKGSCWWGWWKRPSEDARMDAWGRLRATASDENPVVVGLFDSGTGVVYSAEVVAVIEPVGDAAARVHVPPGELDLVPSYYRNSPFSSAWMKLRSIVAEQDFFGNYSYKETPKLPHYSPEALSRFRDKVILSAAELRQMDTTIWFVRPERQGDKTDAVYLTSARLRSAVSAEAIGCKSNVVLHITDPHFAVGPHRQQHVWRLESERMEQRLTMSEAVAAALKSKTTPGLVVVTGDLTFSGQEEEFSEAATSLQRLLGSFDLDTERLVVVPGNHDIRWSTEADYKDDATVTEAPAAARKHYEQFYRRLFGHDANRHLAMGRRFSLPSGITVEICALNSSSLQTGRAFLAGMGRVDEASFGDVAGALGWTEADASLAFRIVALHHHVALTEDLEQIQGYPHGFGIAADAVRIQRLSASRRVQLVIHGHKHRAFVWRSSVYELPEHAQRRYRLGDLSIIGGGSSGSSATEGHRNYFNTITLSPSGIDLNLYRSRETGLFENFQGWKAKFSISDDRLAMSDWEQRESAR